MKIATSVQPPSLRLRERLQQLVPNPTFHLGKSKFHQNHLITLHDPAAPLQKQLPSGAVFNSLLHLAQQHHETASALLTTAALSLRATLWGPSVLPCSPSLATLPICRCFFHTIPKVFLALPSSYIHIAAGLCGCICTGRLGSN